MGEFRMPSLGADMEAGTLIEWLVQPGQRVCRGDIVAVVETDKGNIDIEVWEDGIVEKLLVETGSTVPVEASLAMIASDGSVPSPELPSPTPSPKSQEQPEAPPRPETEAPAPQSASPRIKASPLARKMAAALGLDLSVMTGHGPGGVIQKSDVEKAASSLSQASSVPSSSAPGLRRAIAAAMSRSNREIPHYYLKSRIDLSRTLVWLSKYNAERSARERILPVAMLARAVVLALAKVPALNGFWMEEGYQAQSSIHLGLTVSLRDGGVLNPAIIDAQDRNLSDTMVSISDLIERSRGGRLRASEVDRATITVTSLGDRGVEEVYGVIYPPQVALVGFGRIQEQPWAEGGMLGVRPVVCATLAADHRATDGRVGARLLELVNAALQAPEKM